MKVAFVQWHDSIGGAETLTGQLVRELRKLGVDAGIVLVGPQKQSGSAIADEEVPSRVLGHPRGRDVLRSSATLIQAIQDLGPDAAILPSTGFLAPLLRVRGYKGAIAAIEHGSVLQIDSANGLDYYKKRAEWRIASRSVDLQIAVSDYVFRQIENSSATKKIVIHNGVQLPEAGMKSLEYPHGDFVCSTLSRLVPGKGIDVAIRALASLTDLPQVKLVISGEGESRTDLENLVASLDLSHRVNFAGWTTPEVAWSRAHLALTLSNGLIEGFGLSAVEAMSFGLPVIASERGGLGEVVTLREGVLVKPGNEIDVATAIRSYVANPALYVRHSASALARAKAFDIQEVALKYRYALSVVCSTG